MKKKWKKRIIIVVAVIVVAQIAWIAFAGYEWSWGPFAKLHDIQTSSLPGNDKKYALDQVKKSNNSELRGKKIIFLGSSVTYGAASKGVSFADYIGKRDSVEVVKEAVSGTTLVEAGGNSYIHRMKKLQESDVDMFVCQLSTNDATQKKEFGTVSDSTDLQSFDTETIAGAIEYIICYASETWGCPVIFYTNPKYDSEEYQKMVELLIQIQAKWDIEVINMWDDAKFNDISEEQRSLYMADSIHPTQAGYLEWWTPYMEKELQNY